MLADPAESVIEPQLRAACARLDRQLRAGADERAERLFAEWPALAAKVDAALELIYTEFVIREELGQQPRCADFLARFPQWRSGLEEQFRVHELLRDGGTIPYAVPVPAAAEPVEAAVGAYELLEKIAQGSMAVVWKARQRGLNRVVALKMVLPGVQAGRVEHARLRTEAEAVARLQHPNIVQIFEVGEWHGGEGGLPVPFFSLEFVPGGSLDRKLAGTPRSASYAAELVQTLARAIHYAHQQGIVHRDLKPANVLLTPDGTPKITDFGLAKLLDRVSAHSTESGHIFGTPSYMAPEQADGSARQIGPAADVYALGAILYEVLTGRPPFRAETLLTTLRQVVNDDPAPPDVLQTNVPRDLATVCLKCLNKDPRRRYADAGALADDLGRYLAGEPILARPISLWRRGWKWARRRPSAAALVAVLGATAALLFLGNFWYTGLLQNETRKAQRAAADLEVQEGQAQAAARLARASEAEALRQADLYRQQLEASRRSLYTIQLAQVEATWRTDSAHALELLEDRQSCPPDLRDFAWHLYHHLCQQDRIIARAHPFEARTFAYSADGRLLASVGLREGTVKLWDAATLTPRGTLRTPGREVTLLAFAPDSHLLATAGDDRLIRVWNIETGRERVILRGHTGAVTAMHFAANGKTLVSASNDGTVRVWELAAGRKSTVHQVGTVRCLALTPDGRTMAVSGDDRTVRLWALPDGKELTQLSLEEYGSAAALAISPDGRKLAVAASRAPLVSIWDLTGGGDHVLLRGHVDRVQVLAFAADSLTLATGSQDRTVRLWDLETGAEQLVLRVPVNRLRCLAFAPDGQRLAVCGGDEVIRTWSMTTRNVGRHPARAPLPAQESRITATAYAPDGTQIALAQTDGAIKLLDPGSLSEQGTLTGHAGIVWSLAFAADGRTLASSGEDRTIRLWDAHDQEELAVLATLNHRIYAITFSPDGQTLAAACEYGGLQMWDVASRRELLVIDTAGKVVNAVGYSPDGQTLALGCQDGTVELWDLVHARRRTALAAHARGVLVTAFSPDGKSLATGGLDSVVKIWDVPSGKERAAVRWNIGYVFSAAFTPDSRTIALGGGSRVGSFLNGEVKLYNVVTGYPRGTLPGQTGPVAFAPDGRTLATVDGFTALKFWHAPGAPASPPHR